ncbi:TIGR03089 family protein [Cryptosporangium aurantiacum]|uniref:TIGR03089 family protein n=1 Tax=Cryptosporangium aurantiacum TaxID=134849 RepID=A0A1M7QG07_9ACTN|nr:TIGR03089 family protein [Cryptosporangium aurantiacum]SHN29857.1 TIGR03089 family protein [Cryptosporangium aurantiacum]
MLPALLGATAPAVRDRTVLTYYDDATSERVELTVRALSGWAARTAGLLHEGCGLGVGDQVAVALPPHWRTAGVLLGAWAAGLSVSFRLWATAGLAPAAPVDASFVSAARLRSWLDSPPAARHRFVVGPTPSGCRDYLAEVSRYTDTLPSAAPLSWIDAATVDGTTFREWGRLAAEVGANLGLRGGDRLLVDADAHEHPVEWLLAPLAVGASVVLCANLDRSRLNGRVESDSVTHVLA